MKAVYDSLKKNLEEIEGKISYYEKLEKECEKTAVENLLSSKRPTDDEEAERNYRYWNTKEREAFATLTYLRMIRNHLQDSLSSVAKAAKHMVAYKEVEMI